MDLLKAKKGQLGTDTATAFIIGILVLTVFGFTTILVISSINNSEAVKGTTTVTNETGGFINGTGYQLLRTQQPGVDSVTITSVTNGTAGGGDVVAANYTVTAQGLVLNATNVSVWSDADFSYTFRSPLTNNVGGNVSSGVENLFSNAGTWFSLLAVVVIILIIGIVIVAVNRFGGSVRSPGL